MVPELVEAGLSKKTLVKGKVFVNKRNANEANVRIYQDVEDEDDEITSDVMIIGLQARNRAIHGDVVAVQLLGKDKNGTHRLGKVVAVLQKNWREYVLLRIIHIM